MEQTRSSLSAPRLSITLAGSILGAGYLSGQELWQFFGAYGIRGLLGLGLTLVMIASLSAMVMHLARRTGLLEMDRLIVPWECPPLRRAAAGLELFFLIGIAIIMYAGGGALVQQLLGIPMWLGCLLMCTVVAAVALGGMNGMVNFFSLLVPPAVVVTVLFGIAALVRFGFPAIPASSGTNPLLGGWLLSSFTYTGYNFFTIIGVLAAAGIAGRTHRAVTIGSVGGASILAAIAVSILLALFACPGAAEAELPMLAVAEAISPILSWPYALILLLGMFGSALFSVVTVITYFEAKYPRLQPRRGGVLAVLALFCFPASLAGFGDLISVLYPICGYCSFLFILFLLWHARTVFRR